jgi:hypothetical protein
LAVLIAPVLVPVLDVATTPFQPSDPVPPVAVQDVALELVQESVVDWPTTMLFGAALKEVTLGSGAGALVTLTIAELLEPVPPGPVQVNW